MTEESMYDDINYIINRIVLHSFMNESRYTSITEIVARLLNIFGGDRRAVLEWLEHFNHHLGDVPERLIRKGDYASVLGYLRGVESV